MVRHSINDHSCDLPPPTGARPSWCAKSVFEYPTPNRLSSILAPEKLVVSRNPVRRRIAKHLGWTVSSIEAVYKGGTPALRGEEDDAPAAKRPLLFPSVRGPLVRMPPEEVRLSDQAEDLSARAIVRMSRLGWLKEMPPDYFTPEDQEIMSRAEEWELRIAAASKAAPVDTDELTESIKHLSEVMAYLERREPAWTSGAEVADLARRVTELAEKVEAVEAGQTANDALNHVLQSVTSGKGCSGGGPGPG